MVDRDMRKAEREAGAKALRQRLRAGLISQERVRLAAFLGSGGAAEALGEQLAGKLVESEGNLLGSLRKWLLAVQVAGDEALGHAAASAALAVAP